jgi:hypothetical protein
MYKNMAADHMQNIYFLDQDKSFAMTDLEITDTNGEKKVSLETGHI